MPVQETNLVFKANETSTPTTSGAPESKAGFYPYAKQRLTAYALPTATG